MSWPAEIDVFLAVGELALYVAYLDGWPVRQRVWPWTTALIGLAVSIAGNVGHIQPVPGRPVGLTDRLTAATSPLAAFAGLTVGLLVLRMSRRQTAMYPHLDGQTTRLRALPTMADGATGHHRMEADAGGAPASAAVRDRQGEAPVGGAPHERADTSIANGPDGRLLREARGLYQTAAARGQRLSQRMLARQLRGRGHRFPNQQLRRIAVAVRLDPASEQTSATEE